MTVALDVEKKLVSVYQELTFNNQTNDTLDAIILNDWNNAYSDKNSTLGKRFSDEFERNFLLAKDEDKGFTTNVIILDQNKSTLDWRRLEDKVDIIKIRLENKLAPNQSVKLFLIYSLKIPNDSFTGYGFGKKNNFYLKDFFLTPARYENGAFVTNSNANIDDVANSISDYELEVSIPKGHELTTDLNQDSYLENPITNSYTLSGKNRQSFSFILGKKSNYFSYSNGTIEVLSNIDDSKLDDIKKAIIIDRIVGFVNDNIGNYPHQKITVSQADYDRNPFYGLNQLPSFLSPFSNEFLYELKFLKTYINNFLRSSVNLNQRNDYWISDGIQVYMMMKYMDEFHPQSKMMGSIARFKILKSFNLINLDFNQQYSYYYLLMVRKNLDQALNQPKDKLIRFNERIASKYKAGLSFNYLDSYLEQNIIPTSIKEFYTLSSTKQTTRADFETILKSKSTKNIDWFFNTIIDSRDLIDYKFGKIIKEKDSVTFTIKNNKITTVPIPVFGIKNKQVLFKKWLENIKTDSTFTVPKTDYDKIVINYKNEVPENNLRNNWKSLKRLGLNRPLKFAFMKDLENPYYNQILYVPSFEYNLYDGAMLGLRFHTKTILEKPFVLDVNPMYATNSESLSGSFSFGINKDYREGKLFNMKYFMSGSRFHYAPDATYFKMNPSISMTFRDPDLRNNHKSGISARYNIINKEKSKFLLQEKEDNYSIFNLRYFNFTNEITSLFSYGTDFQYSNGFSKISGSIFYRKLYDDNRQLSLRLYAGSFITNKTISDYYSFGISNPNDYLFEQNLLGRSESSGLFSQQYVVGDGGFKSKIMPANANKWLVTSNASFTIWNWIELYGDIGLAKNKSISPEFIYDNGIRLNFVQDFFELYLPIYSNNGWEIAQPNYDEKIRFLITVSPKTLLNLFTRKWF